MSKKVSRPYIFNLGTRFSILEQAGISHIDSLVVDAGGSTYFEWAEVDVAPKLGRVAIWPSVLDHDPRQRDRRTRHASLPLHYGEKVRRLRK